MSPDIERAIEQLEAKIAELMSARDTLIETFDPPDSPRRRLVLARRASAAERARKRGEAPSPATANPVTAEADPRVGPTVSGATVYYQGAAPGSDQGPTQRVELDYQNLGRRITRKDALAEFLREHGPSTRAEILHGLAIPPGSIAYVLNDRNRFVLVEGKWHNVPDQQSVQEPASERSEPVSEGTAEALAPVADPVKA
jgi:hypothetical protein